MQREFSSFKVGKSRASFLTILLLFAISTIAISEPISSVNPSQTVGISKSSPRVSLSLDYPNAFEMSLKNLDSTQDLFCETIPSEVNAVVQYETKFENTTGLDNIIFHKGFYYVLDTQTFNVLVIRDGTKPETNLLIPSMIQNMKERGDEYYESFLTIDTKEDVLYIATKKAVLQYNLNGLFQAISSQTPIPKISKRLDLANFTSISYVVHHDDFLFIVADNIVTAYLTAKDAKPVIHKLDQKFFNHSTLSFADIAFYGTHVLLLDSIDGIYMVDMKDAKAQSLIKNEGMIQKIEKGQFIEVIGKSVNVVTASKKATKLYEYIIEDAQGSLTLDLNRVTDVFQAVSDVKADGNFLYLITGFFNVVLRPYVPGNYDSDFSRRYIANFWPLFQMKSLAATTKDGISQLFVVQEGAYSLHNFEASNPMIQCDIQNIPEGEYNIQLKALQTTCAEKNTDDINTICTTTQNLRLVIAADEAIGDIGRSNDISFGLIIGLGFMGALILLFCYLVRKYKKEYHRLRSMEGAGQFKFKELQEEGEATQ